jgi:hypothetical protein
MATFFLLLHTGGVVAVVGMCDEFIALLWSVDFCVKKNKGLNAIGTFYFNGALISQTLCLVQQVIGFQIPTRPLLVSGKSTL